MKRTEIFKNTHDNWCGNWDGDQVKLSYHGNIEPIKTKPPVFRVSCWGNDDFGMERDFSIEGDAIEMYEMLSHKVVIDQDTLDLLGFTVS